MRMYRSISSSKEKGFTLIEILTVIIIIGILAAVAIPVFSSQRGRAQDAKTISDVRNVVTTAETYLIDRTKTVSDLSKTALSVDFAASDGVAWDIKGNATTNGYCIAAYHANGKVYNSNSSLLTYDSTGGGLKQAGSSCSGNTPVPSGSTAGATSGSAAPAALVTTSQSAPWAIAGEDLNRQAIVDGGFLYVAGANASNPGIQKIDLTTGTRTKLNSQRAYIGITKVGDKFYASDTSSPANIYEISSTGNSSTLRLSNVAGYADNLASDGTNLYVPYVDSGVINKFTVNSDGTLTNRTPFVSGAGQVFSLAFDSRTNSLYYGNNAGTISRKNVTTNDVVQVATNVGSVRAILPTSTDKIYVGRYSTNPFVAVENGSVTTAGTLPYNGNDGFAIGIATDGTRVYIINYSSTGGANAGVYRF